MINRYIIIETEMDIAKYKLNKDVGQMVRVRKGLYRTDNKFMIQDLLCGDSYVPYILGHTQPRGAGVFEPTRFTMAYCRLAQTNNQKPSILRKFSIKYLGYGLLAFAVIYGVIGSMLT